MVKFQLLDSTGQTASRAVLITNENPDYSSLNLNPEETNTVQRIKEAKKTVISFYKGAGTDMFQFLELKPSQNANLEAARVAGANLAGELKSQNIQEITISTDSKDNDILFSYAVGLALASYRFLKYKKDAPDKSLKTIHIKGDIDERGLHELQAIVDGIYHARDLVNTPSSHQTAEELSTSIQEMGDLAGFKMEVLNKSKIEALKMGGLLSVAAGSIDPPTFNILEWKPENAINQKPVILVGKGVVFDTGGLTLKPTPNSMDLMKSDMAGAAAVAGTMYALAKAKMPYHVIGLIPATDNRPGMKATAPGDVITMYGGTTVEVMNTDAEGRLILGDALEYAKKYDPDIVIDLATLTGAAVKAIGQYGIIFMGTADENDKAILKKSGEETYERLVELPLWDEYDDLIKSDIADLRNVSSSTNAGAITAGKFLEHFTGDYPWIHLDIAGPAYISSTDAYRTKNATGAGIRLLIKYLKNRYPNA
jgi:leucyl aminopeptidase